jgi:hypothetical protein
MSIQKDNNMINHGQAKEINLNIVGSSIFGRYPKISTEKTLNLFESDGFMVPYAGYQIAINARKFKNGKSGRALFTSTKLNAMIAVIDNTVWLTQITFNQTNDIVIFSSQVPVGTLSTSEGQVYITENNNYQVLISDRVKLYIYAPLQTPSFSIPEINFTPGYVTFHDQRFLAAASNDVTNGTPLNNTWRLSLPENGSDSGGAGTGWPSTAAYVGLLTTKPDNTQAVVRMPSKGNMILVMGKIVTEAWFDTGAQLFPYQRTNQISIDYGCLNPATVAYMDQIVVWLAQNEKSGPVIMFSEGGTPEIITTDGIDYLFAQLQNPEDSEGFLYRQDGHLFYHINFYSDNLSLYYDFNTKKFYNACDQNFNYFIAGDVAFYQNQYYFITKNNGNLFAFDTIFTTYQDTDANNNVITHVIPRQRICKNIRSASQGYFVLNDIGFTIESGETNYFQQDLGNISLIYQNGNYIETQGFYFDLVTQDDQFLVAQSPSDTYFAIQQTNPNESYLLIAQQDELVNTVPAVDLALSYDGGAEFGNNWRYNLPAIGVRKNRLLWWQCGMSNDIVPMFTFWGIGRFTITEGQAHIRE